MNNEEMVVQYKKTKSQEVLDLILSKNERLMWKVIKDFGNKNNDQEDSYQDAVEGLIQAVRSYDPKKGTRFSTWAYQQIRNYIQNNDPSYDRRERQIYRYLNRNQDKTHEEIWEVIKNTPNNDISKELFDLVATKREIPIDKKIHDKDGNMMFLVDMHKSSDQDHSQIYYDDTFKTLNSRQKQIANLLLEDNTHIYIKKYLRLSDNDFAKDIKTIRDKVKRRL